MENTISENFARLQMVIDTIREPALLLDDKLYLKYANTAFLNKFNLPAAAIFDKLFFDIDNARWNNPGLKKVLSNLTPANPSFADVAISAPSALPNSSYLINARLISGKVSSGNFILLCIEEKQHAADANQAASENRYKNIILTSPFLMAVFYGPQMIITIANDVILNTWGKGTDVLGKPLAVVLPEIIDQGLMDILQKVYTTGEPFTAYEMPVHIMRNGCMELSYYTFSYLAQRDVNGKIESVVVTAAEVTKEAELNKKLKDSAAEFSTLADNMSQFAWMADDKGWIYWYNQRWYDYTGTTLEEVQGWGWQKVHHPDHIDRVVERIQFSWDTGEVWEDTFPLKGKDGNYRWFLSRALPIKNEDGKIARWFGTNTDITDQKNLIGELDETVNKLQLYEKAIINTNEGVLITEAHPIAMPGPRIVFANEAFCAMTGYCQEEIVGQTPRILQGPKTDKKALEKIRTALQNRQSVKVELINYKKNGEEFVVEFEIVPVTDKNGECTNWLSVQREITERKNSEKALQQIATHLQLSTTAAGVGTWFYLLQKGTLEWSDLHKQMWGYDASRTDLLFEDWHKVIHPDDKANCFAEVEAARKEKRQYEVDYRILRANDGAVRWMKSVGHYLFNDKGEAVSLTGISIDITDAKIAEEKLVSSELRFRKLADQAPMWIWLTDKEVNILYANEALLQFVGIAHSDEFTGKVWEAIVHPDDIKTVYKNYNEGTSRQASFNFECRIKNALRGEYEWIFLNVVTRYEGATFAGFIGTAINIQEQKNILSQLQYRKALLEAHNESSIDGILLVDAKGKILSYNQRFVEIWNMPKKIVDDKDDEAALSFALTQILKPEQFIERVKWLYDHPNKISVDELEFKNGKIVERHGYPVQASDGSYYAWSWMFRDITEKRNSENALKESEARLKTLISTAPIAIGLFIGRNLVIENPNQEFIDIVGKGPDITGKRLTEVMPELIEYGQPYLKILDDIFTSGKMYQSLGDSVKIIRNGVMHHGFYNIYYVPLFDTQGNVYGIMDIATDVTEQALFNKKIKDSEANFRLLAEQMPQKIANADAKGKVFYYNKNWVEYTGLSEARLVEEGWAKVMHPEELEEISRGWQHAVNTGEIFEMEHRLLDKNGDYKWHLNRSAPVKSETGDIIQWVSALTEIQKIKEEEQRKSDFIKMVSHELKTPVTSIKGYVQLLLSMLRHQKEEQLLPILPLQTSLERIDKQILRLTRLITEMLDLSRLEESKLELNLENFSLNDLLTETIQDIQYSNVTHTINVQQAFKAQVFCDKDRIQQVIINFINNAIKYSPAMDIIEITILDAGDNKVSLTVKDFGIGIAKEHQQKIFERFYRVQGKNEETFSGFGIGLFIANEIIQRHHGNISVESEPGEGSVFTFTLPLAIKS